MKKIAGAFVLLLFCLPGFSQTLFTYGKYTVSKSEFLKAFNKNPNITGNRKKALKEYLDLYVNFKLKVQAAYDAHLQNDAVQIAELNNFKLQIADNIINDEAKMGSLVQEAFVRSQKDIHLAQVFIEVPANGDTAAAYKAIQQAYAELKKGKEFAAVSADYSTDITMKNNGGDMGYITVFTFPYLFENVAYQTAPNNYSAPFRSKLGYHIFKNIEERKAVGTLKIGQILIAFPPNGTKAEAEAARIKADSIYALLVKGRNFGELARLTSNDVSSVNSDGVLQEFGIGTYDPVFERTAYSLKDAGQISKPFATGFGYHIIQLVEAIPVGTDVNNVETLAGLQQKVLKDERLVMAKNKMLDSQLKRIAYKPGTIKQPELWRYTDSILVNNKAVGFAFTNTTPVFSFNRQNLTVADWIDYVRQSRSSSPSPKSYTEEMKNFLSASAANYYRNHLEVYSPEFKQQVNEFKDANLLFGIMDTNVWSRANNDTAGLHDYYSQHAAKYTWQPNALALIVTCNNNAIVEELQNRLERTPEDWKLIIDSYGNQASADSGRYELAQLPVVDRTRFVDKMVTAPVKNQGDNSATFNYIFSVNKGGEPRTFDDSKGMVISDYQQLLEDKWIENLKKKYPVKINMAVFNSIK